MDVIFSSMLIIRKDQRVMDHYAKVMGICKNFDQHMIEH